MLVIIFSNRFPLSSAEFAMAVFVSTRFFILSLKYSICFLSVDTDAKIHHVKDILVFHLKKKVCWNICNVSNSDKCFYDFAIVMFHISRKCLALTYERKYSILK